MTNTRSAWPATTPMSWVISSRAMPSVWRSRPNSSRICAWVVTSSAVVGSSAISSRGSQISAAAITARCRMPPDSSCGNRVSCSRGRGSPTRSSISAAASRAADLLAPRCSRSVSPTWSPIRWVGFSEVIGSWKTMPTSAPRTLRSSRSASPVSSRPASAMLPRVIAFSGSSPASARPRVDLPQPDSPTMPTVSPAATASETSCTACTTERRSAMSTSRPVTSRTGPPAGPAALTRASHRARRRPAGRRRSG